jgi:hypothetical protein
MLADFVSHLFSRSMTDQDMTKRPRGALFRGSLGMKRFSRLVMIKTIRRKSGQFWPLSRPVMGFRGQIVPSRNIDYAFSEIFPTTSSER